MMAIKRVRVEELATAKNPYPVEDQPGEYFILELITGEPNSDGLYEVPRSVHFVQPAMSAQNLLISNRFEYVGPKKGNYDVELWRRMETNDTFPGNVSIGQHISAGGAHITGDMVTSRLAVGTHSPSDDNDLSARLHAIRQHLIECLGDVDLMIQGLNENAS